jgi:hypothetical protein
MLAMSESQLTRIKSAEGGWPHHAEMGWQAISTAPFDRDLQLAVIDARGIHALVFPCRRVLHGWVNAGTQETVLVRPTHWREWDDAR